jgi:hypothetical protein
MKKAVEYLIGNDVVKFLDERGIGCIWVEKLIKQAQSDAIDAAVKMCADEAREVFGYRQEDAIREVANKLKREL